MKADSMHGDVKSCSQIKILDTISKKTKTLQIAVKDWSLKALSIDVVKSISLRANDVTEGGKELPEI